MLQPKKLSGHAILIQLEQVNQQFGKAPNNKKRKRTSGELNWTKKSIFFDLPYWSTLGLRHNLDVMHIEKNICDNVLGTLLNLPGKTKDSINTRLDLAELGIKPELHLVDNGNSYDMPAACYTLSDAECKFFCQWLNSVKFPDGYASNISRCVNEKDGKISGLKSHNCHVLLQRLLPVALRGFLSTDVSKSLIEWGIFFKELCCRTLRLEVLEKMEKDIAVILCKLEEIFPPAFFDIMVHLAVHLPHEAILAGPVQYRWMYPIERYLHTLKQYVRNKAHPEGSIAETYIDNECLTFCCMYLQGIETRFNHKERNDDGGDKKQKGLQVFRQNVRTFKGSKSVLLDLKDWDKAHFYVLNNSEEILQYIDEHLAELERENPNSLQERHELTFAKWFKSHMQKLRAKDSPLATDDIYSLACGPDRRATLHTGCIVNGIRFRTKKQETHLKTQNSGVVVKGDHQSQDKDFYGVLVDIIELEYIYENRVFLFKCDWWDTSRRTGIHVDSHFTSVNVSKTWYKDDPYILSTQASQVFYVNDTQLRGDWKVVQRIDPRNVYDVLEKEEENQSNEAYQQEEQLAVDGIISHDQVQEGRNNVGEIEETTPIRLNRLDVTANNIDADVLMAHMERNRMEYTAIDSDGIDEDDDTLMNYCSEEDGVLVSDDDTDID